MHSTDGRACGGPGDMARSPGGFMTHVRVVVSSRPQRRWHMQRHTCPAGPLDPHPAVPYADQGWQCWCAQHDGLPGDVPAAAVSMDGWSLCRHSHRQRTVSRTLWQGGTCHVCTPPPNLSLHMPLNMHAHACPKVLLCTFARRVSTYGMQCAGLHGGTLQLVGLEVSAACGS